MKTGILIANIGTPDSLDIKDIQRYLRRFLMDKNVITLPFVFRWLLVNLIIVPFRSKKSKAKYEKIWTPEGSPLKHITEKFVQKLQNQLGTSYFVTYGMSYSTPDLKSALRTLKKQHVEKIVVIPMYPQYAQATTGSVIDDCLAIQKQDLPDIPIHFIHSFYDKDFFISHLVDENNIISNDWIFSFHGLPKKDVLKNKSCKLNTDCCFSKNTCVNTCYYAQCLKTSHLLAQKLKLKDNQWTMTFQSRLGVKEWLSPYTDNVLNEKAKMKTPVQVICPAFTFDCLETLEEIQIENKDLYLKAGGTDYHVHPCLNAKDEWINSFADYIKNNSID